MLSLACPSGFWKGTCYFSKGESLACLPSFYPVRNPYLVAHWQTSYQTFCASRKLVFNSSYFYQFIKKITTWQAYMGVIFHSVAYLAEKLLSWSENRNGEACQHHRDPRAASPSSPAPGKGMMPGQEGGARKPCLISPIILLLEWVLKGSFWRVVKSLAAWRYCCQEQNDACATSLKKNEQNLGTAEDLDCILNNKHL